MDNPGTQRQSTGIDGLDEILHGGLIANRSYLVRGNPGVGKTILGMHYLTEGARADESVLFVNLEESKDDIEQNAQSLNFDLADIEFLDLSPDSEFFTDERDYDLFSPGEVEHDAITDRLREQIERIEPDRVFVDPISQLRYLSPDEYQFRKEVVGFIEFLKERGATIVCTSQETDQLTDDDLQYLSDGIIELGRDRNGRTVELPKFRGSSVRGGLHSLRITDDGLVVSPKLDSNSHTKEYERETLSSGIPEADEHLHGGLERGTITVISGPTGAGKTTTGSQFVKEAASRGEDSIIYLFEESRETFLARSESVNIPVRSLMDRGILRIKEVEPYEMSADEFAQDVRHEVEERDARIVMIDGVAGYRLAIRGGNDALNRELHTLGNYLRSTGVLTILIEETPDITGDFRATTRDISYIADNIIFLRHLEVHGELEKAIGVIKKRVSDFENSLRRFEITEHGMRVGERLTNLHGILSGTPEIDDRIGHDHERNDD